MIPQLQYLHPDLPEICSPGPSLSLVFLLQLWLLLLFWWLFALLDAAVKYWPWSGWDFGPRCVFPPHEVLFSLTYSCGHCAVWHPVFAFPALTPWLSSGPIQCLHLSVPKIPYIQHVQKEPMTSVTSCIPLTCTHRVFLSITSFFQLNILCCFPVNLPASQSA